MNTFDRQKIADGIYFNTVHDERFKTVRITVNAYVPLEKETAAQNALLSQVLTRSCNKYRTMTDLSRRLGYLYGASLYGGVSKVGDCQSITVSACAIDDRYTAGGEIISSEISSLICDVLFDPYVENGSFVQSEIEQERRQLYEMIDAEFNDKQVYARERMNRIMCGDEPCGLPRYGSRKDIERTDGKALFEAWKKLLQSARFEIMYVGCADSDSARRIFAQAFGKRQRSPVEISHRVVSDVAAVKNVTESMALSQSKIVMGFRTAVAEGTADTTAMRLACTILGGTASSKLFNNVREKLSLCYYCSSRYQRIKGIMLVQSGVESENIEKTKKAILNELEDMKKGNISDFEFNAAKLAVCDSFRGMTDTVEGLEGWYTSQLFYGNINSTAEEIKRFESVTKRDVIDAVQHVCLDTVFVLEGNGGKSNAD